MSTTLTLLIPIFCGIMIVFQTALNQEAEKISSLPWMLVVSSSVFFAGSCILLLIKSSTTGFEFKIPKFNSYIYLSGLLGILIVTGGALSFKYLGALTTTCLLIVSQFISSYILDFYRGESNLNWSAVAGLIVMSIGVSVYICSINPKN